MIPRLDGVASDECGVKRKVEFPEQHYGAGGEESTADRMSLSVVPGK